jgi:hypothetical protein
MGVNNKTYPAQSKEFPLCAGKFLVQGFGGYQVGASGGDVLDENRA